MSILLLLIISEGCRLNLSDILKYDDVNKSKEYGYVFQETTGDNHYIIIDQKKIPIHFGEPSNSMALHSLMALKPSILYANADGKKLFLVGEYSPASNIFILKNWYIKTPFDELKIMNETTIPHEIEKVSRSALEKTDFNLTQKFDPNDQDFVLSTFQRREAR